MMSERDTHGFPDSGRFSLRRRLGAGGMGVVFEAYDRDRDQLVALKTILRGDPSSLYRFKKEFRSLAHLSHVNLIPLYELISEGDRWFFTMELVDGEDFLRFVCPEAPQSEGNPQAEISTRTHSLFVGEPVLERTEPNNDARPSSDPGTEPMPTAAASGRLFERPLEGTNAANAAADREGTKPPLPALFSLAGPDRPRGPHYGRLRSLLRQLATALSFLHGQGILHRDIKPSNVLVTRQGRLILLDFGLSTEFERPDSGETTPGLVVGTDAYMSPEQAVGETLSPASDWYSVGVMLYRALTGRLPYTGKRFEVTLAKLASQAIAPRVLNPDIPDELDALCRDLLQRDPAARPTAEQVLKRLGGPAVGEDIDPLPGGASARPFVGRTAHFAALNDAFAALRGGRPTVVFVHGQSGAGKSTLLQHFLESISQGGEAIVLAGRCYEQESVAYKALDTLIDALSRFLRSLTPLEAGALLPRDVAPLARVFPVLRRVEAIANAPVREREAPDPQELRRRAFAALRELLARIGDRKPLVLSIDDLQWGDLDSALLLSGLLRPPDPPVLLLVASYRSEYAELSSCLKELLRPGGIALSDEDRRTLNVGALTPADCRALALAFFGEADPFAGLKADAVVRESRGSPFFALELAQYLTEVGDLVVDESSAEEITLDMVLWRRIGRLPAGAQRLLETIAVAGQPLRQSSACRASGLGSEGYVLLGLLRNEHLVKGTGAGSLDDVEAYHDQIRESVVRNLAPEELRALHRALAEELEAAGQSDSETLAVHLDEAGETARAGRYYAEAADAAAGALAFDRAAKLYLRALELLPPGDAALSGLQARLADALANAGRGDEAARAYLDAATEAGPDDALDLQRRAGYQFLSSGRIDQGLETFQTVLKRFGTQLPRTPKAALLRLLWTRAKLRLRGLRFRERPEAEVPPELLIEADTISSVALGTSIVDVIRGSDFQARSLLLALKAGEPIRVAQALGWEAVHVSCNGGWRRARRLIVQAETLAARIGHPRARGVAALAAGAVAYEEGHFRRTLANVDRAAAIFRGECTGMVWETDTSQIFGFWSLIYLGELAELTRRMAVVLKEARERGDLYLETTVNTYIAAMSSLAEDRPDEASERSAAAIARWTQKGHHVQHLTDFYAHLYADQYRGDWPGAWRRMRETRPALEASMLTRIAQVRIDMNQHSARCAIGAAMADPGQRAHRLHEAETMVKKLQRERIAWASAMATLARAGIASLRGDAAMAERLLGASAEQFDAVELRLYAAAARRTLGTLKGGDEGSALISLADRWMNEQNVRNPARLAAALVPGFPS